MGDHHSAFRDRLHREYLEARSRNPNYSLRAFAKKLGLAPSALSELFMGKRQLSIRRMKLVMDRQGWSPLERAEVFGASERGRPAPYRVLEQDEFALISEWFHFALLSLLECRGLRRATAATLAKRLGLPIHKTRAALDRLCRLSLIQQRGSYFSLSGPLQLSSSDELRSLAIQRAHLEDLELSRQGLLDVEPSLRDFTSITMGIDVTKIPQAKRLIRQFRDELAGLLETAPRENRSEVYKLCVHLFPLTRGSQGKVQGKISLEEAKS